MAIGSAMIIGGNEVKLNSKGKVEITNPKGKVITLSQDKFLKQTIKNSDKIYYGEDFEYKKDHKALKIAGAAVGTAAIATGIIYRKEIGKYMKNITWKKFKSDIEDLFGKAKDKIKETKDKITDKIKGKNTTPEKTNAERYKQTLKKRKDARAAFENMTDETKPLQRKYLKPDGTLMNDEERKAFDAANKPKKSEKK